MEEDKQVSAEEVSPLYLFIPFIQTIAVICIVFFRRLYRYDNVA